MNGANVSHSGWVAVKGILFILISLCVNFARGAVLQVNSEGDTHDLTEDHPELGDWPQGLAN